MIVNEYNLKIGCRATNLKNKVIETKELLLLKSYDTFISIYVKSKKLLINNIDYYKISNTTKKHYYAFRQTLNVNHKIYLNNDNFYELVRIALFEDLGNIDVKVSHIFKEYELEKALLEAINNYDFNLNENYNFNVGSFNVIDNSKVALKTRNKEIILCELPNTIIKPLVEITLTTNKNRTKILSSKVKLISKAGLSFNNYNTKELNEYTVYHY